jgi:hypothetical protein
VSPTCARQRHTHTACQAPRKSSGVSTHSHRSSTAHLFGVPISLRFIFHDGCLQLTGNQESIFRSSSFRHLRCNIAKGAGGLQRSGNRPTLKLVAYNRNVDLAVQWQSGRGPSCSRGEADPLCPPAAARHQLSSPERHNLFGALARKQLPPKRNSNFAFFVFLVFFVAQVLFVQPFCKSGRASLAKRSICSLRSGQ